MSCPRKRTLIGPLPGRAGDGVVAKAIINRQIRGVKNRESIVLFAYVRMLFLSPIGDLKVADKI